MVEPERIDDGDLEEALLRVRPRASRVRRDEVMYQAGRASRGETGGRRWANVLTTAAGWLLAVGFCGLWMRQHEPVVVTEVRYIERGESTNPDLVTDEPAIRLASESRTAVSRQSEGIESRVRRQTVGDLEERLLERMNRRRQVPDQSSTGAGQGAIDVQTVRARFTNDDSYLGLMRAYRASSQRNSFSGDRL